MSKFNDLRVLYWNADGIRTKILELVDLVSDLAVDVVAICETRLGRNVNLVIPGFKCYRQDKHPSGGGQGVAIFVKTEIQHFPISTPSTVHMEAVGVQLRISGEDHIILSIYQSPNLPLVTSDLSNILRLGPKMILAGDLNAKHPFWSNGAANPRGNTLLNHMQEHEFIIHAPVDSTLVHYSDGPQPSTPDLVITYNVHNINDITTIQSLSSNHFPVLLSVGGSFDREVQTYYKYSEANWSGFRSYLNDSINLTSKTFKSKNEIDCELDKLSNLLMAARDKFVPKVVAVPRSKPLPNFIKRMIKVKNRLRARILRERDHNLRKSLRIQINELQSRIKHSLTRHYDDLWDKKLAKVENAHIDLWKIVKSLRNKPDSIPPLQKSDGSVTTNILEQCNELASAFYNNMRLTLDWHDVETDLLVSKSLVQLESHTISKLEHAVHPHEIQKILRNLKIRKSPGVDNIQNALLKNMSQKCVVLLTRLLNGCLLLGYFPNCWKTAKVIALKKPGKIDTIPSHYRPISLLPTLGKILERVVCDRLLRDVIHINEQFGFRRGHSTVQQLARVSEHIAHNFNFKNSTGMFLLDLEKAFDTVWHDGLLHKLIKENVSLNIVKIIKCYLNNRVFRVHNCNTVSDTFSVPAGVPQGSVLGPILFLVYVNDIPIQPRTHLACFADDTASFTSSTDTNLIIDRLQCAIDVLCAYFNKWKLKLNESKTEAILFTRKRALPRRNLNIGGHPVRWQKVVKYLGVMIDNKTNWSLHVDYIKLKGIKALNALSPILNRKTNLSPATKLKIYSTLVRPCLTYAAPVWSSTCATNYDKLQVIQNKALKIAYRTPFRTNLKILHQVINFPILKEFIIKLTKKFYLHKNKNHLNTLIAKIGLSRYKSLPYIDTYKRYRLPHHHVLDIYEDSTSNNLCDL